MEMREAIDLHIILVTEEEQRIGIRIGLLLPEQSRHGTKQISVALDGILVEVGVGADEAEHLPRLAYVLISQNPLRQRNNQITCYCNVMWFYPGANKCVTCRKALICIFALDM